MKKILGFFLILSGVILIIISIMGLVKAFDVFSNMDSSKESIGYTFGSIIFPLLLTVTGRWILRKGIKFMKSESNSKGKS
jgi:multisubunit Na+/H+ antiporter MnhG subunit